MVGRALQFPARTTTGLFRLLHVMKPLNILLLCNRPARNADASTVTDHLDAFLNYSRHSVTQLSFLRQLPSRVDLDRFDAVVIHYTIAIGYFSEHFINQQAKQRIRNFRGLKIVFIQDEYRAVNTVLETLKFLRADVLFTCVPEGEIEKVYSADALPGMIKINTLTGYVPKALLQRAVPKIAERRLHVAYRTRKPPYWLGELGYEKWQIADRFEHNAQGKGLSLDLSYDESQRIYGERWIDFVASCKTMLGVESGASVFDFTGSLQRTVDEYVARHPDATFQEVQEKFLRPYEGLIRLNQISPRCFEAAALRTVMLLYEGDYSGILKPWRHYVPLKKDCSNFDEVLDILRDDARLQEMADRTYAEVALNPAYTYEAFIAGFDDVVEQAFLARNLAPTAHPYTLLGYRIAIMSSVRYVLRRAMALTLQRILLGTGLRRLLFRIWGNVPLNTRNLVRPLLRIIGR